MLHRMGLLLVLISVSAAAQESKPVGAEDAGYLDVSRTHIFPSDNAPGVVWSVRDLENRSLGEPTCKTYKWNAQSFQYETVVAPDPCKPGAH